MKKACIQNYLGPKSLKDIGLPVAKPGILLETNAGWRVVRPLLDLNKCVNCLQCYLICPDGCIGKAAGGLTIDYDYCKGCGMCARECKPGAITMISEEEC